MRLKFISCKILNREASYLIAQSGNRIDTTFLKKGFHKEPDKLRQAVQNEIDLVESGQDVHTNDDMDSNEDFSAILIGYGLCSNGIAGLKSTKYPLVIPRAHDCITLFLGSKQRYQDYFTTHSGTYWYSQSWLENSPPKNEVYFDRIRKKYEEKGYDEDAIEFLLESETNWINNYNNAVFVRIPEVTPAGGDSACREEVREIAGSFGWCYEELEGDISLLRDFFDGNWHEDAFLVVPPGKSVVQSFDDDIIKTRSIETETN